MGSSVAAAESDAGEIPSAAAAAVHCDDVASTELEEASDAASALDTLSAVVAHDADTERLNRAELRAALALTEN